MYPDLRRPRFRRGLSCGICPKWYAKESAPIVALRGRCVLMSTVHLRLKKMTYTLNKQPSSARTMILFSFKKIYIYTYISIVWIKRSEVASAACQSLFYFSLTSDYHTQSIHFGQRAGRSHTFSYRAQEASTVSVTNKITFGYDQRRPLLPTDLGNLLHIKNLIYVLYLYTKTTWFL